MCPPGVRTGDLRDVPQGAQVPNRVTKSAAESPGWISLAKEWGSHLVQKSRKNGASALRSASQARSLYDFLDLILATAARLLIKNLPDWQESFLPIVIKRWFSKNVWGSKKRHLLKMVHVKMKLSGYWRCVARRASQRDGQGLE